MSDDDKAIRAARARAIRTARQERDWSIARAARELVAICVQPLPDPDSVIVAWKRWERGVEPCSRYREPLSALLRIDRDVLAGRRYPESVDRRDFLAATSLGLAGLTGDLPGMALLDGQRRLGDGDMSRFAARRDRLGVLAYEEGAGVYAPVVSFTRRLEQYARRCEYSEQVGAALRDLCAEMASMCSALAWDAGLEREARDWGRTAIETTQSPDHAALAIAYLARQALDAVRPVEALGLLGGAPHAARPGVRSALAARAALAHAQLGERRAAMDELRLAHRSLDRQRLRSFMMSPATVSYHEAQVAERLGDHAGAEAAAREAIRVHGDRPSRIRALYLLRLASILIQRAELEEARAHVARAAEPEIASPLVIRELAAVRRELATAAA